jgi:hypothetical protein
LKDIGKDIKDALNIYGDVDKPLKDIGKDIKGALNVKGDIDKPVGESEKSKDDEKSQ